MRLQTCLQTALQACLQACLKAILQLSVQACQLTRPTREYKSARSTNVATYSAMCPGLHEEHRVCFHEMVDERTAALHACELTCFLEQMTLASH